MSYLRRRLEKLVSDVEQSRVRFAPHVWEDLAPDLAAVRKAEDGTLLLESCSPRLRSFARAYYGAAEALNTPADASAGSASARVDTSPGKSAELNRTLLAVYAELFEGLTGAPPDRFVPKSSTFDQEIRRLGERLQAEPSLAERIESRATEAAAKLQAHYEQSGNIRLSTAAALPGVKAVLGGQKSLAGSGVAAIRSTILYCDTILIPDPVHRWVETEPFAERFSKARMLEDIFHLYQLKPIIDANFPDVPLLIFPSWERVFEEHDPQTKDGIELLTLSVFGKALGATFDDIEELTGFVRANPEALLEAVDRHRLFVPEGGSPGMPLPAALAAHKAAIEQWRSEDYLVMWRRFTDAQRVFLSICDRLAPQFHALDNAESLRAQPLFSLSVQWHYFQTCFSLEAESSALSTETLRVLRGLTGDTASWLTNVPLTDLARLREDMEMIEFRKKLKGVLGELDNVTDTNLDTSLQTTGRALAKLLIDHDKDVRRINEEFNRAAGRTAIHLLIGTGAAFLPWLPTFVGALTAAGITAAGALSSGLFETADRKRQLGRTMMGVLAASARSKNR